VTLPSPLAGEGDSQPLLRAGRGGAPALVDSPPVRTQLPPAAPRTYAKAMRHATTDAERELWQILRAKRLAAYKFRRQQPIGAFIADFVCYGCRLIVEADGRHHADNQHHAVRTAWLEAQGFRVLRFWNTEILSNGDGVARSILAALESPLSPLGCAESPSPARGEGKEGSV
jgi:very-short-patch-repair endonuclease